MKYDFPPNIEPNIFSLYAVILGVICVDDYSMDELNTMGNWVILFGQYLLTYSAQLQLIEARIEGKNININSKAHKNGGSPYVNGSKSNQNTRNEVEYLLNAVNKIQKELEKMKNDTN